MKTHTFSSIPKIGDFLLSQFQSMIAEKGIISIALSGGNTPQQLFAYWRDFKSNETAWHNIHYYWVDERAVAPTHAESNYGVANSLFFEPLGISKSHVFRMQGEIEPSVEAQRYATLLKENILQKDGVPQFNFMILGLGDDGHTASIFPGQEIDMFQSTKFCKESINPYTKQKRITLTGTVLNNAEKLFFIILGEQKKQIFSDVFLEETTRKKYPAQHISPIHTDIQIITDLPL